MLGGSNCKTYFITPLAILAKQSGRFTSQGIKFFAVLCIVLRDTIIQTIPNGHFTWQNLSYILKMSLTRICQVCNNSLPTSMSGRQGKT